MHELTITQSILHIALEAAQEQKASRIRVIYLSIGPFSGIVPECIQMYLDVLAKGTCAQGAKIEAKVLPLRVYCNDCGQESEITREHIQCPICGGLNLKRLSGRELMVERLEVD